MKKGYRLEDEVGKPDRLSRCEIAEQGRVYDPQLNETGLKEPICNLLAKWMNEHGEESEVDRCRSLLHVTVRARRVRDRRFSMHPLISKTTSAIRQPLKRRRGGSSSAKATFHGILNIMGYDFKSLSSYDFALLARDLLQVALEKRLETFSEGPDCGIDFRYRDSGSNLIVQSKHYAESGYNALVSTLRRKERAKVERLRPTRYLLATSVSLTPNRKEEIYEILTPYCLTTSDIYGREDLNSLLTQNDEIERRHFKLWLTSEAVLRRVLHAGIFVDSNAHLDRVRLRLQRYVQNPSFERARTLLDTHHYCIIAGIPGIGKTTLAEVLLADLVDRQAGCPFFR